MTPAITLHSIEIDARAMFGDDARVVLTSIAGCPCYAVTRGTDPLPIMPAGVLLACCTLESLSRAMRAAIR